MTPRSWRAEVQLSSDVKAEERQESQLPDPDRRFLILVMGDFRGRQGTGAAGDTPVRERPFVRIDRDDFDSVMARFGVRWNGSILPFPGDPRADTAVSLAIPDIDGFHPDRLVT
ncbi:MAG: hypothetical protein FJW35_17290, partial [Acidobacteria bacterium]|nr:hypothetical protein [Acidobacteriota bacterium]